MNFESLPKLPCLCFKVVHDITQRKKAAVTSSAPNLFEAFQTTLQSAIFNVDTCYPVKPTCWFYDTLHVLEQKEKEEHFVVFVGFTSTFHSVSWQQSIFK